MQGVFAWSLKASLNHPNRGGGKEGDRERGKESMCMHACACVRVCVCVSFSALLQRR